MLVACLVMRSTGPLLHRRQNLEFEYSLKCKRVTSGSSMSFFLFCLPRKAMLPRLETPRYAINMQSQLVRSFSCPGLLIIIYHRTIRQRMVVAPPHSKTLSTPSERHPSHLGKSQDSSATSVSHLGREARTHLTHHEYATC